MDSGSGYWKYLSKKAKKYRIDGRIKTRPKQETKIHNKQLSFRTNKEKIDSANPLQPNRVAIPKKPQIPNKKLRILIQDEIQPSRQKRQIKISKIRLVQKLSNPYLVMVTISKIIRISKTYSIIILNKSYKKGDHKSS